MKSAPARRSTPGFPCAAGILGIALTSMLPRSAQAVEHEHHFGADVGGGLLRADGNTEVGAGGGLHWAYGLDDTFNLMAEGSFALASFATISDSTHATPRSIADIDVGVGYVFDVLTWVPYVGVLIGGYLLTGGALESPKLLPGAALAVGLDYRFGRSLAAGVAFRQHMLVTEVTTYPSFSQLFARVEYTWGW